MDYKQLIINPGSTSTKLAVYENEKNLFSVNLEHSDKDLAAFDSLMDQLPYRNNLVLETLKEKGVQLSQLSAVMGRGGILPPVKPGGYRVNEEMKEVLTHRPVFAHASNLGALMAAAGAAPRGIPAYIYDSVTADEFTEIARTTGFPEVQRQSFCHMLNMRAVARKVAEARGARYEDLSMVIAHLGGGISVSAHKKGRVVDSISDDGGPFSPERSGSMNLVYIIEMCFSGKYTKAEMLKKTRGSGGLKAHLGTSDCRKIEEMIANGDQKAALLYDAQAYQVAKGICSLLPALEGPADAIVLTGGLAYSKLLTTKIIDMIKFYAPVELSPGEDEMEALALGGLRILRGEEAPLEFHEADSRTPS